MYGPLGNPEWGLLRGRGVQRGRYPERIAGENRNREFFFIPSNSIKRRIISVDYPIGANIALVTMKLFPVFSEGSGF